MKKFIKKISSLLLVILFAIPVVSASAKTNNNILGLCEYYVNEELEFIRDYIDEKNTPAIKTYSKDLDNDGKNETIKIKYTYKRASNDPEDEDKYYEFTYQTFVYINGKQIYKSKKSNTLSKVMIVDTDKKDNQKEVLIFEHTNSREDSWTTSFKHIYYFRYAKGKTTKVQDLKNLFNNKFKKFKSEYGIHGYDINNYVKPNGKGTLTGIYCLGSFGSSASNNYFDYVHIKVDINIKNGKFYKTTKDEFEVMKDSYEYHCSSQTVKQKTNLYKTAGSKKVAFKIKKNTEITSYRVSIVNGVLYFKVKTDDGKSGYINPSKVKTFGSGSLHI